MVRSIRRPPLSVRLVTVNVPVPAVGDVTLTVHVPAAPVVHGLGVTSVPVPDQVNAIDAPAAGIVVVPSVTVAVTVKLCCVPIGLLIDGEIVTVYATHVFEAVAGAITGMSVTGTPPTVVDAIAVTVRVSVPGPASCTRRSHVPPLVPAVRHDDAGSSIPEPEGVTASVVPSGTAVQSASVGSITSECCTVAVNVCATPVRFVALGVSNTRYCDHVFVAVSGTVWPGA